MKILGMELKIADVLAIPIFITTLVTFLIATKDYIRGVQLELLPPTTITIFADGLNTKNNQYLRFGLPFTYYNNGGSQYSVTVLFEQLTFKHGGHEITHEWEAFKTRPWINGKVQENFRSTAHPVIVKGQGMEWHVTEFTPRFRDCRNIDGECDPRSNFIKWGDFLDQMTARARENENEEHGFEYFVNGVSHLSDGSKRTITCRFVTNIKMLEDIRRSKVNTFNCM